MKKTISALLNDEKIKTALGYTGVNLASRAARIDAVCFIIPAIAEITCREIGQMIATAAKEQHIFESAVEVEYNDGVLFVGNHHRRVCPSTGAMIDM